MEVVSMTSDNPSSVKSDDSSPPHESGRGSPPPKCAICLGTCRNKSYTDYCLHQFCFKCILTWSKVKAECPLCKQTFKSIIHNVQSNDQYEEYRVEQRHEESAERIDIDTITTASRRFRYRTTLTLPRRESAVLHRFLLQYPLMSDAVLPPALPPPPTQHEASSSYPSMLNTRASSVYGRPQPRRRRSPASFRRTVYRHNLWARPLPDFTGRFRDCSPDFYRYNFIQTQRLVPWINRELQYLLNENIGHITYVLSRVMELLPQYHITSPQFRDAMRLYLGERTDHFLHELYCFASTPYDITGYDRHVQYTTDQRISTMVNEVISSTDSDASADSDIVVVSSSHPASVPPLTQAQPSQNGGTATVVRIETISHSDTDDDEDVTLVGYIKPPRERTPEVVDLLDSESDDVVVSESNQRADANTNVYTSLEEAGPSTSGPDRLVKLTLKRHSRSPSSGHTPPNTPPLPFPRTTRPTRKRTRRNSSSSVQDPDFVTEDCNSIPSSSFTSYSSTSSTDRESSPETKRKRRKRTRRKEREERRLKRRGEKKSNQKRSDKSKRSKREPNSERGRSREEAGPSRPREVPGPSRPREEPGLSRPREELGPSRPREEVPGPSRPRRESKKLRSTVASSTSSNTSTRSNLLDVISRAVLDPRSSYHSDGGSQPSDEQSHTLPTEILERVDSCFQPDTQRDSDSDSDDLPLNLTVKNYARTTRR